MENNSDKIVLGIMLVVIVFLSCILGYLLITKKSSITDKPVLEKENSIAEYVLDENGNRFSNKEIMIQFDESVDYERGKELINEIDGENIARASWISYIGACEVEFKERFKTYDDIVNYCDKINKDYEEIKIAFPSRMEEITID